MNQEDFELNENESIKSILTRDSTYKKNIECKSKIKAMIHYCAQPVLVQLEEITMSFLPSLKGILNKVAKTSSI